MSAIRKRTVRIAARLSTKNKTCPKCGNNDIRPGRRYCWLCGHTFRKRKEDPPVFRPQLPISHPVPDLGDVCEMKTDCAVADFHPTGVGDMVNFDPSKIRTGDPCIMYASAKKGNSRYRIWFRRCYDRCPHPGCGKTDWVCKASFGL